MHHGEDRHLVAELFFIEQRAVALDVASLLQRTNAAQAGRGRDADPARQFDGGDAAVLLQLLEDLAVDGIEAGGHKALHKRMTGSAIAIHTGKYYFAKQYCA